MGAPERSLPVRALCGHGHPGHRRLNRSRPIPPPATLVKINLGSNDRIRENQKLFVSRGKDFVANLVILKTDMRFAIAKVDTLSRKVEVQNGDAVTTVFSNSPLPPRKGQSHVSIWNVDAGRAFPKQGRRSTCTPSWPLPRLFSSRPRALFMWIAASKVGPDGSPFAQAGGRSNQPSKRGN